MTDRSVCAVIVTYHPTQEMTDNIPKVVAQVQGVVVVDNGSNPDELLRLRQGSQKEAFHLIGNGANLGIAEALNQGVCWAKDQGYSWVILFDQDSRITNGFIDSMFASWENHPRREFIGAIHPQYVNPSTGVAPWVFRAKDGGPISSMTSGALMPTWIFDKLGLFPAEYFIDQVDTEYGLRIRAAGYLNADSKTAVLLHSAGHAKKFTLLGFTCEPTHHSATRRYYFSRNRIAIVRKYFSVFPRFIFHFMYISFRETVKCFLAEENRAPKLRSFILGTWDGLTGRMGKREGI